MIADRSPWGERSRQGRPLALAATIMPRSGRGVCALTADLTSRVACRSALALTGEGG